jgi:transposase
VAERVRVREIDDDEGERLVRIVRRGTGSVVTWRRAQMVLLSAQNMDVAGIARVAFTSEDHVRDVIHNFNADRFDSLYPRYRGGRPPKFTLPQRREIKKIAKTRPAEHGLPFSTWSLSKLAEFLVAEGVVDDISHEGLRILLREEGVTFQRLKTWKGSTDPEFAQKKARIERLYAIADGEAEPREGEPGVVICVDLCRGRDYVEDPSVVLESSRTNGDPLASGAQPWFRAVRMACATSAGRTGLVGRPSQFPGWGRPVRTTSVVPGATASSTANVSGVQPLPWL